jgi:predicted transcriptional regulator
MPVDASIPLRANTAITDPAEAYGRMFQLKALAGQSQLQDLQTQQLRQNMDDERALGELYKGSVNPDGTLNRSAIVSGAAQRGLGRQLPKIQESFQKLDKEQSEIDKNRAGTKETELKVIKQKLEIAGGMISSLLTMPNVTADDVVAKVSSLVNQGLIPPEEGVQMIRQVPGNPAALRQFLLQKGMEVVEAGKRIEMLTPKIDYKQTGKQMVPVDTNALTNPNPQPLTMTTTPGEDQSAAVSIRGQNVSAATTQRGQNMTDARERELAAQGVTYQTDESGNMIALPSKAVPGSVVRGAPVLAPNGVKPLVGKGAGLTEDQGKATGWLQQASNAYGNMLKVLKVNPDAATPGLGDAVAAIPGGAAVGNYLRSSDRQQFIQAASSLSESLLRAATGAGINAHEAEQKIKEITPQWGDTEKNIKQKLDAIPVYLESLKVRAGPGARKLTTTTPAAAPQGALGTGTVNFQVPSDIDAIIKKYGGK